MALRYSMTLEICRVSSSLSLSPSLSFLLFSCVFTVEGNPLLLVPLYSSIFLPPPFPLLFGKKKMLVGRSVDPATSGRNVSETGGVGCLVCSDPPETQTDHTRREEGSLTALRRMRSTFLAAQVKKNGGSSSSQYRHRDILLLSSNNAGG